MRSGPCLRLVTREEREPVEKLSVHLLNRGERMGKIMVKGLWVPEHLGNLVASKYMGWPKARNKTNIKEVCRMKEP